MENNITLFLLFAYSIFTLVVAIILLKNSKLSSFKSNHLKNSYKLNPNHNLLNQLTNPMFNLQYEINRKIKNLSNKTNNKVPTSNLENSLINNENIENKDKKNLTSMQNIDNTLNSNIKINDENYYQIDQKTLDILINTFSYDDFAKLYEKFLNTTDEDKICKLIDELYDFRDDDRILMILTPLLSNENPKIQNAIQKFITSLDTSNLTIELANLIENYSFKNQNFIAENKSNNIKDNEILNKKFDLENNNYEQISKLILEAYQTNDPNKLFEISNVLSYYNDPVILETLVYINSKLNSILNNIQTNNFSPKDTNVNSNNLSSKPKIIKANQNFKQEADIKKFEFSSINDIFKKEFKIQFNNENKNTDHNFRNSYIEGISLVNMARLIDISDGINKVKSTLLNENTYVRCCAIKALKTLAERAQLNNDIINLNEIKNVILNHEMTEKNNEVINLCQKAINEIENLIKVMENNNFENYNNTNEFHYQNSDLLKEENENQQIKIINA